MKRLLSTLATLALLLAASQALAGDKTIVIGVGLMHGTADIAANGVTKPGVNGAFQTPELGARLEYWNFMKEDYALNFQANVGFSSETDKPRSDAPPGTTEAKFTTSSWSLRLGGDRTWSPNDETKLFFGPGIEYWTGKAKFEEIYGAGTYETENVTRVSLHGHTGAIMMMGDNWGLSGQIGHKISMASYEEAGGKVNWWPNSFDGAMELVFSFGY